MCAPGLADENNTAATSDPFVALDEIPTIAAVDPDVPVIDAEPPAIEISDSEDDEEKKQLRRQLYLRTKELR